MAVCAIAAVEENGDCMGIEVVWNIERADATCVPTLNRGAELARNGHSRCLDASYAELTVMEVQGMLEAKLDVVHGRGLSQEDDERSQTASHLSSVAQLDRLEHTAANGICQVDKFGGCRNVCDEDSAIDAVGQRLRWRIARIIIDVILQEVRSRAC